MDSETLQFTLGQRDQKLENIYVSQESLKSMFVAENEKTWRAIERSNERIRSLEDFALIIRSQARGIAFVTSAAISAFGFLLFNFKQVLLWIKQ